MQPQMFEKSLVPGKLNCIITSSIQGKRFLLIINVNIITLLIARVLQVITKMASIGAEDPSPGQLKGQNAQKYLRVGCKVFLNYLQSSKKQSRKLNNTFYK